ncbi:GIY-YIG nuclease family protein [Myxococcus sp. K15C18031901]|uniref:GIY-YIG nuclease family protein n=1 Tax=Myxococcus dinghuensis TaxID=2906761 RepID=UPI0020A710DE|nr:GIY-YIG nuclease family protein [Myxococcus dinghuensis]MCP3103130.1 GIY-YIG nuclease family protein [Myxococcus dinghuensis]
MGTVSHTSEASSLQECKVRASRLLKELGSPDATRAARAAERLRALPVFAGLPLGEVLARRDSVQRKHVLAVIAREQGHASWGELKRARESSPVDFERLLSRAGGNSLNRWFTTYAEAVASLRAEGGYLFPFREQFFVCERGLLAALGLDPADADWALAGPDWLAPLDVEAHARLEQRLRRSMPDDAPPSSPLTRKSPMSSTDPSSSSGGRSRRSELKRGYKEKPPPMGVYAVRNRANGKVLVGASLNLPGMLNRIRFELETGMPRIPALLEDWRRHGADQFSFDVLDVLEPPEEPGVDLKAELQVLEALWLDRLQPYGDAGYNERPK